MLESRFTSGDQDTGRVGKNGDIFLTFPGDDAFEYRFGRR